MSITVRLPWPPSGNHAYTVARGRKILSSQGRSYRDLAVYLASSQISRCAHPEGLEGPVSVHIVANEPDRRHRDIDNLLKLPLDCLTKAGAWSDDSKIDDLRIVRGAVDREPHLLVTITQIQRLDA